LRQVDKLNHMKILEPNGLVDNLYKYVHTNIEITKIEVQERIEDASKKAVIAGVLALTGAIFLVFFFITIALILNHFLESNFMGFLIVTLILSIVMGVVFYFTKDHLLKKPTENTIKSIEEDTENVLLNE
jgi:cytochrome c biogenesis protein CcdA